MKPYRLVACSFHDELEAIATLHTRCAIAYRDYDDIPQTVTAHIVDVYSANGADFIKLDDATIIRLDHLISVAGKPVKFTNSPLP